MRIEECIQYVLLRHPYVSLPGIGSFVRERIPSRINSLQQIQPIQYKLSFNQERVFDDEALRTYLLQHSTLEEEEVERILQKWLKVLQHNLEKELPIHFQGIGVLKKNGRNYTLIPDSSKLNLTAAVLTSVQLPRTKGISKRKTRRNSIGIVAAISSSIVILGVLFIYWIASPPSTQDTFSSIVTLRDSMRDSLKIDTTFCPLTLTDTSHINKEAQQILDSTHRQINALRVEKSLTSEKKYVYYVVAGSFSSIENANKLKEELLQKGYKPIVRKISSMYRVTLGKFYDKKTGIKEMNKRRTELNNDSYWLIETLENKE